MKKKIISTILVFALSMLLAFSLVGCKSEPIKEKNGKLIAGFNSYNEVQTFNYYNSFGAVDVNTDKNFVTEGDASAKLTIYGKPRSSAPSMHIYTDTIYADIKDFSKVYMVTFDVYNADSAPTKLTFNFNTFNKNRQRKSYRDTILTLPSKTWVNAVIPIDRAVAGLLCDPTFSECLTFTFEGNVKDTDTPKTVYIDNLNAYFSADEVTPISKSFADKEIINFDDDKDIYFVQSDTLCRPSCKPELSINRNAKYAKSGMSLKVAMPKSNHIVDAYSFSGVEFPGSLMNQIDFTLLSPETAEGGALTFSVYNDSNKQRRLYFNLFDNVMGQSFCYTDLLPHKWNDVEFSYSYLVERGIKLSAVERMKMLFDDASGDDVAFNLYFDEIKLKYNKI